MTKPSYNNPNESCTQSILKDRRVREVLFVMNFLIQRRMGLNQPMYVCYLAYNKVFDKVQHNRVIKLLENKNLDIQYIIIFSSLYYNQKAVVKEGNIIRENGN